jgi:hypothetical protein
MRFILKILFAPVIFVLWFFTGICTVLVRISATVLFFVAILFAVMGVITIVTDDTLRGCIGLCVAFLLSPYGLPMLAAWLLALCHGLRFWLKDVIYG